MLVRGEDVCVKAISSGAEFGAAAGQLRVLRLCPGEWQCSQRFAFPALPESRNGKTES